MVFFIFILIQPEKLINRTPKIANGQLALRQVHGGNQRVALHKAVGGRHRQCCRPDLAKKMYSGTWRTGAHLLPYFGSSSRTSMMNSNGTTISMCEAVPRDQPTASTRGALPTSMCWTTRAKCRAGYARTQQRTCRPTTRYCHKRATYNRPRARKFSCARPTRRESKSVYSNGENNEIHV